MVDHEAYLRGLRARRAQARRDDAVAATRAREVAERLAAFLRERYGARRVILTGSLARGTFRRGSDVDLAAEGVAPEVFFRAGAELEALAEGLSVDLVPIESATVAYRDELARTGVVLVDA